MIATYTEAEATRILSQYPAHPDTDRIRYMPEDPALIVPLVQQGWIDAAIIPASDELKAGLQRPENFMVPEQVRQYSGAIIEPIDKLPNVLNKFQHGRLKACQAFMKAGGFDQDNEVQAHILAYQPGCYTAFEPKLHVDRTLNVYTASAGAPMEFLTISVPTERVGGLMFGCKDFEEQKTFLNDIGVCRNVENHLTALEHGDILVFGPNLIHKSSQFVKDKGLIAYSLNPTKAAREEKEGDIKEVWTPTNPPLASSYGAVLRRVEGARYGGNEPTVF